MPSPWPVVLQELTGVAAQGEGLQRGGPQQRQLPQGPDAVLRKAQVLDLRHLWQLPDRRQVVAVQIQVFASVTFRVMDNLAQIFVNKN